MTAIYYDVTVYHRTALGALVSEMFSTYGRSAAPAYESPAIFIDGRVTQPGLLALSMYADKQTRGARAIGHGAGVLVNADGALDDYLGYALDGCSYQVQRRGGTTEPYVFAGTVEQCTVDERMVTFHLRDLIADFDKSALPTRYAGTNALPAGVEGTANDIKGQPKPMVIGSVKNVSPVCVNTSKLIYQVDGQRGLVTGWALTVYDKRATLTAGATYADQATMESTAPAAGQYRVWPAGGMCRLGSGLSGQITCDVTNPVSTYTEFDVPAPVTGCEVHLVMGELLHAVNATLVIHGDDLADVPDCGIYLSQDATYLQAANQLARSVGISWYFNPGSVTDVYMRQMAEPSSLTLGADHAIDHTSIIGGLERVVSGDDDSGLPAWRVNVNYLRNYTVMQPAELAGVAIADVAFCGQEYRTASAEDASVKTQWPNAPEITVATLLVTEADAAAEAARLLALYKVRRDMFTFELFESDAFGIALAERIDLSYPRFGLDAGKSFQVIGIRPDFDKRTVQFTVWG